MRKERLFRRIFTYILAVAMIVAVVNIYQNNQPSMVRAIGDLSVDFGVPEGDPIFVINNMLPTDSESHSADVTNNGSEPRDVKVKGVVQSETGSISTVLSIVVSEGTTDLYGGSSPTGPKHLSDFFTESGPNGIPLSSINGGDSTTYIFKVTFDAEAGNEFQGKSVVFDLIIGIGGSDGEVPAECSQITFDGEPIFGTAGNDKIKGNGGNNLIFGLEGNDKIDGGGGDDCIVGGEGNDRITDSSGRDVIFGNAGNDYIDAGSGNDLVNGGEGNDHLIGGSGNDIVFGNSGEDHLEGGSDNDDLHGGTENDLLEGGSGQDQLFGDEGQDNLRGGSDNDFLDGGFGGGSLNGDSGIDTCVNWTTKIKCEL